MILNPAAPINFFLPVGIEITRDGEAGTGVYVAQPYGAGWRTGITRAVIRRRVAPGVSVGCWHWTRATDRKS